MRWNRQGPPPSRCAALAAQRSVVPTIAEPRIVLNRLSDKVAVLSKGPGASAEELTALAQKFPGLPSSFHELMALGTDVEMNYKGTYLRLYGPATILDMNAGYEISTVIPGAVPVGDNGSGSAVVWTYGVEGVRQGLYRVAYGDLGRDTLNYIAATLEALLVRGEANPEAISGVANG